MIIGIDLGTTHSLAALWRDGRAELIPNALGEFLTPSVVSLDDDGSILVGRAARERLQSHPARTAAAFKRAMGTATTFTLGPRHFRAEELSSLVLRALRDDAQALLGEPVHEAVITVPAYFSDAQRQATRSAGLLAGFTSVTLLNEPSAAALAYGLHQQHSETQFLVFDFGGGTFDVSILEMFDGVMEVRATAGDNHLGGEDVNEALMHAFIAHAKLPEKAASDPLVRARLDARIEQAKKALTSEDKTRIVLPVQQAEYSMELTSDRLETMIQPLLERLRTPVERAMRDARIRVDDIRAVVLVGGSTRLRAVRHLVTRMFGRFPETALNPDEVVALGAAVQAGLKMKDAALSEHVMTDVCPYTLGIAISREIGSGRHAGGFMSAILERNTVIPASRVERFSPMEDYQRVLSIQVYQGEARRVQDNIALGDIDLPLPKGKRTEVAADVRFTYDVSGLLEIEATPLFNGEATSSPARLVIKNTAHHLSPEQIAEKLAALSALKIHPRDQLEHRTLLARAERHHMQLLGHARDHLAHAITQYEMGLETQDERQITPAREYLEKLLAEIESEKYLADD